jgi:hypothetical protein
LTSATGLPPASTPFILPGDKSLVDATLKNPIAQPTFGNTSRLCCHIIKRFSARLVSERKLIIDEHRTAIEGQQLMGYAEIWKILDAMVMEFRKRNEPVPVNIIEDLRAAKTMIQVLNADPKRTEHIPSIEMYLGNVESYLIFVGDQKFGAQFADRWMDKLREAKKTIRIGEKESAWESTSKFVPGVPKGRKWLRVRVSAETSEEEIKRHAEELGLSTEVRADGYILVFGDEEQLKRFVQKTGEKLRRQKSG